MVEHAGLRVQLHYIKETHSDSIYLVEDFLRNCHAKIEDEIVFPALLRSQGDLKQVISRLEADHKLIDKIGDQIKLKTVEGDKEALMKRISLYADTLLSHNASEEALIFQRWNATGFEEGEVVARSLEIITDYGLDRYFSVTGISEKLLSMVK